jgi:lipopolysaccharide/colanic/teichoic acid biosynthesis glycosyltransferase
MNSGSAPTAGKGNIALLNADEATMSVLSECDLNGATLLQFRTGADLIQYWAKDEGAISAIICRSEAIDQSGIYFLETLQEEGFPDIPFILLASKVDPNIIRLCINTGVADIFKLPLNKAHIETRVNFLMQNWQMMQQKAQPGKASNYRTPFIKRLFDIVFSGLALILLSPVFLIVMIIMKIESKGPVFYYSLRVGTGYRIFRFYKFRSMYVNADKRLKDLAHLNQYTKSEDDPRITHTTALCDHCVKNGTACQRVLYADNNVWCEKHYLNHRKAVGGSAFFKLKDDPRITKVGKILRNTSLDELPQLWNVFIGDMSIVGNRPLPLYEAEKLTTDKYALRFRAPSGITGLWQVEKRGKANMSEEERLMLDNMYAEHHSLASDIKLILRTIPALFQKENV